MTLILISSLIKMPKPKEFNLFYGYYNMVNGENQVINRKTKPNKISRRRISVLNFQLLAARLSSSLLLYKSSKVFLNN